MNYNLKQDIIEWDVPNWAEALSFWQPVIDKLPKDSKILAIGERGGGLSLWLALQGFHVVCSDRTLPLSQAMTLHQKYKVSDKITYRGLDIFHIDEAEVYDLVLMKSVIGGLKLQYHDAASRNAAAQHQAIYNIHALLKPGGYLLTADNLEGSFAMRYLRARLQKNKGWHYFTPAGMELLFAPFSDVSIRYFGVFPTKFAVAACNSLFFFFNKYLLNCLPASSKYIAFTIARK